MKIGDTFSDGQKRTWTVSECLGRGMWGRTFVVRSTSGEELERVLKVALGPEDFPSDAPLPPDVPKACRDAVTEQARLLERGDLPFLPKLEGTVTLADGRPGLLLPRYGHSLARRLDGGMPLTAAVQLAQRVATLLDRAGRVHGNLRPSNVLLNDRGEPVLTDLLTPAAERRLARLEAFSNQRPRWRPPEAHGRASAMWDTWALCQVLWQASMTRDGATAGAHRLEPPVDGLDKVAIATLKDRAIARLTNERANPRFRGRLTDRLGSVLNRGLSRPAEPSPPYRFVDCAALLPRLDEVAALVAPRVEEVGRVLLAAGADTHGRFQGGDEVGFVVSVGCTPGVADHDDVVCGLQLVDLDAPGDGRVPVADARFRVTTHPSGRMRFQFTLPKVPPGRYRVKTAFTIKDGGQEPQVADGAFEVRPPPGYVPPAEQVEPAATPIAFPGRTPTARAPRIHAPVEAEPAVAVDDDRDEAPDPASDPGHDGVPDPELAEVTRPGAEIIDGLFPRPIAPPQDWAPPQDDPVDEHPTVEHTAVPAVVEVEETEASVADAYGYRARVPSAGIPSAATDATAPSMQAAAGPVGWAGGPSAPGPSIAMPRPTLQPGAPSAASAHATSRPAPQAPLPQPPNVQPGVAAAASAYATLPPSEVDDDGWEASLAGWDNPPGDAFGFGIEQEALPHAEGEDLPSWRRAELPFDASAIPGLGRALELVKRDSHTAFVAAVAGCIVLLLACMALLRAC